VYSHRVIRAPCYSGTTQEGIFVSNTRLLLSMAQLSSYVLLQKYFLTSVAYYIHMGCPKPPKLVRKKSALKVLPQKVYSIFKLSLSLGSFPFARRYLGNT